MACRECGMETTAHRPTCSTFGAAAQPFRDVGGKWLTSGEVSIVLGLGVNLVKQWAWRYCRQNRSAAKYLPWVEVIQPNGSPTFWANTQNIVTWVATQRPDLVMRWTANFQEEAKTPTKVQGHRHRLTNHVRGLCWCGEPTVVGRERCQECLQEDAQGAKRRRDEKRALLSLLSSSSGRTATARRQFLAVTRPRKPLSGSRTSSTAAARWS